jgi:hypothetical protein
MRVRLALYGAALGCLCLAPMVSAQDAVKVDPQHYAVVSENDQVRILKVHYGPHEKSVMHSHPATVAVFLTDAKGQFAYRMAKSKTLTSRRASRNTKPPLPTCRRTPATTGWI